MDAIVKHFACTALLTSAALAASLGLARAAPQDATDQAATDQIAPDASAASAGAKARVRRSRHASDRGMAGKSMAGKNLAAAGAKGTGPTVLGDSIGIGLSMASGAPRLAHEGVAIRSSAALAQIRRVPGGSVVVLSLGTNDAVGSIHGVEGAIERIKDVADRNDLKVIWLGPPCVLKTWNTTAERLDAILKDRLRDDGNVRYVSAADRGVCDRSLRAGDGVHFTMKGYAMLWKRVVDARNAWTGNAWTGSARDRDARADEPARSAGDGTTKVSGGTAWNDR